MPVRDRVLIAALAGVGVAAVLRLADWWFRPVHVGQPVLYVLLSLAFWYAVSRIVLGWVNYAALAKPPRREVNSNRPVMGRPPRLRLAPLRGKWG